MLSIYTSSLVLSVDITAMTSALQTYFTTELTTVTDFSVMIVRQEECKGSDRYVQKLAK